MMNWGMVHGVYFQLRDAKRFMSSNFDECGLYSEVSQRKTRNEPAKEKGDGVAAHPPESVGRLQAKADGHEFATRDTAPFDG
jgi:hypothetical protein